MNVNALFEHFKQQRILVIGDVMIDAYLMGKVSRVSPEAPVPIVNFDSREVRLGGAANVALNLLSLGAKVMMCTVVGKDTTGNTMMQLMSDANIDTAGVVQSDSRLTTVKTRIIGNKQQLLRIDEEQTNDLVKGEEELLIANVAEQIKKGVDAIIFEDYNKGVLTHKVITEVIALANNNNIITTVDPKLKSFFSFKNVTLFKPNFKELQDGIQRSVNVKDQLELKRGIEDLKKALSATYVFVTLSEHGVVMLSDSAYHHIPAHIRNIADVSGAGDTVISVATLCLVAGLPPERIAEIANLAGGLVCEELGVVAIQANMLRKEVEKLLAC